LPNLLIGMVAGSVLAVFLKDYTNGIKLVGEIPAQLPPLSMPESSFETIRMLAPEAFAVALLGLIEAVSISRAVATRSSQRIDANQEFIGQGMSNMVGSFFSSYAGSGSFTRSGLNYESGAKTPLSAIFAALLLMLIVLLVAPLTAYLPIAAMGGVVLGVAAFSTAGIAAAPLSGTARLVGGLWIVLGSVLFFGTIVATVTAYFMRPLQGPHKRIIDTIEYNLEQLDDLTVDELDLLKETVDTLIAHVEHLKEVQLGG
jgi:MFS superfamily sulfate permease-like transporter